MKNHIVEFFSSPAIRVVIGCNGYIWIDVIRAASQQSTEISQQERYQIAVLRNAFSLLDRAHLPIFKDTIVKVIEEWQVSQMHPKQMLASAEELTKSAKEMVDKEIDAGRPIDVQKLMA